jgi:hypothetical protein
MSKTGLRIKGGKDDDKEWGLRRELKDRRS